VADNQLIALYSHKLVYGIVRVRCLQPCFEDLDHSLAPPAVPVPGQGLCIENTHTDLIP
jgi:hypothetical protein